uniref:Importin subunit beta-1 n=1 Tax=Aceria tosichella TaxID=561515 RepID=A0A6G1SM36_9ACAR
MEDLTRVLERSISSNQTDQNEAVKYIQEFCQKDFVGFIQALSDVLYDQQNQPVVRAAAGLQLKNQLTARDEHLRHQQQERWRALPESTRAHIKDRVFKSLGTEIFRPWSAPQCVAYIALIELPEQQWPGLIPALAANVTDTTSNQQLKLASLEAIGYICQDIDQTCIQASDSKHILDAIVLHGIRDDECEEVKRAATTALLSLYETKVHQVSKLHQNVSFAQLGDLLNIEPQYAEKIIAQMIREERIQGHLNQIDGTVHFESKDILQVFDEEILKLCSEVNHIVEKIKVVVPDQWWSSSTN